MVDGEMILYNGWCPCYYKQVEHTTQTCNTILPEYDCWMVDENPKFIIVSVAIL